MERHDLPVVSGMIVRLAQHHGDDALIDLARLEADLFGPGPWLHGLVVERFGFIVGYALLTPRYRAQSSQRGFDLHHLFVLEGARGLGLGRQLVAAVVDHARQAECGFLRVYAARQNGRAQDFYRSLGFDACEGSEGFAMPLQ